MNAPNTKAAKAVTASRRQPMGSYTKLTYHIVFSTKYRQRIITEEIRSRLYEYLGSTIRNFKGSLLEIGGIEDHLHLLTHLPAAKSIADSVRDIKANVSKWANELPVIEARFEWQKGYGAFTVSHSQIDPVRYYIQN